MSLLKKLLILVLVCLLILCGCTDANTDSDNTTQSQPTYTIETQETIEPTVSDTTQESDIVNITPPSETVEVIFHDNDDMVLIEDVIPNIIVDLKYSTEDNFTGKQIYESETKAMLRYGTANKLAVAQDQLNKIGLTLVIWDAYRPPEAQFKLWEAYPDSRYVANPNNGNYSSHSRGNTVDITVVCLDGTEIQMPTKFDDFSKKADRDYDDVDEKTKGYALLVEDIMKDCGFKPYSAEWWHYTDTDTYDVYQTDKVV